MEIVPGDTEAGLGDVALDDLGRAQGEERLLFICYHGMMSLGEKETTKSDEIVDIGENMYAKENLSETLFMEILINVRYV